MFYDIILAIYSVFFDVTLSVNMAGGFHRLTWISRAGTRTMRARDHDALEPRMEKFMEKQLRTIM